MSKRSGRCGNSPRSPLSSKAMVRFVNDEEGATAIEYALIAGLISMGIIVGAALVGTTLGNFFTTVSGNFP